MTWNSTTKHDYQAMKVIERHKKRGIIIMSIPERRRSQPWRTSNFREVRNSDVAWRGIRTRWWRHVTWPALRPATQRRAHGKDLTRGTEYDTRATILLFSLPIFINFNLCLPLYGLITLIYSLPPAHTAMDMFNKIPIIEVLLQSLSLNTCPF